MPRWRFTAETEVPAALTAARRSLSLTPNSFVHHRTSQSSLTLIFERS